MNSIACPHCGEKTFSWWDKYRTGKWALLRCSSCKGRVCAQPIVLAVLYFLYVWDVVLFGYLAYLDSLWYLLVMLVGWLILDYFSVYVPLAALRTAGLGQAERESDVQVNDQSSVIASINDVKTIASKNKVKEE